MQIIHPSGSAPVLAGTGRSPGLSSKALTMLMEAAVVRDHHVPDGEHDLVRHALDINGYVAHDIAWLHAPDGHVVLVLPGNVRPVREYADLAAMRADIRIIAASSAGRAELASHFVPSSRADGLGYRGLDRWLRDIGDGGHDRRIACCRQPFSGNVLLAAGLSGAGLAS